MTLIKKVHAYHLDSMGSIRVGQAFVKWLRLLPGFHGVKIEAGQDTNWAATELGFNESSPQRQQVRQGRNHPPAIFTVKCSIDLHLGITVKTKRLPGYLHASG